MILLPDLRECRGYTQAGTLIAEAAPSTTPPPQQQRLCPPTVPLARVLASVQEPLEAVRVQRLLAPIWGQLPLAKTDHDFWGALGICTQRYLWPAGWVGG